MRKNELPPTRADVARQRLARLVESFDAELEADEASEPAPERARSGYVGGRAIVPAHLRVVAIAAVAACVLLAWYLLAQRPEASPPVAAVGLASEEETQSAPSGEIVVDVIGKVERPGIVTLPPGSRVHHAVEKAGGVVGKTDTSALNMARELDDGEQIIVGEEAGEGPAGEAAPGKLNLNRSSLDELDTLPGVGPVTAQAIVSWRDDNGRFGSVDDLLNVDGIGEATLAKLRDLVTV